MAAPLRIACLNENLSGHASFHRQLIEAARRLEHVTIRSVDLPDRSERFLHRLAANPWPLPAGWDCDFALLRHQIGRSVASRPLLRELVADCDIVHFYTQNACAFPGHSLSGKPYVFTTDATTAQTSQHFGFRYPGRGSMLSAAASGRVERRFAQRAGAVIAQSAWARDGFAAMGIDAAKLHVVPLGAPAPFEPVDRSGRSGVPVRVVFIGATMGRKGGHALLDALSDRLGRDVEVQLVTRERVDQREGVVVRTDVRPGDGKIERLLAQADIFALPSDMDMSPNAVFEAMASGLPIVAYRTGAIPEMVTDGVTGLLVEPRDIRGLRTALYALIDSVVLRTELGAAGRLRLASVYDPDTATRRWLDIVRSVAGLD